MYCLNLLIFPLCIFVNYRDSRDIEMTNLQAHVQLQSNTTANQNFQSPAISKKVSRMGGIATPLAGISTIQSPLR